MKIAIIGSGAMATACAKVLHKSGHENIWFYGIDSDELKDLRQGYNKKYFGDHKFPKFNTTEKMEEAITEAHYIVIAIPSQFIKDTFSEIQSILEVVKKDKPIIINVAKGFYDETGLSLHEGLVKDSNKEKTRAVVSLIGPSHAEEIVLEMPTIVAAVSKDVPASKRVARLFMNDIFKIYLQDDVIGAEVGAAYKNILAICSGMIDGKGYGINTKAALLTRGLYEMSQFNEEMGGDGETIYGLTGVGDLIVTALSPLSRNFTFGKKYIEDKKWLETNKTTVEGLESLKHIYSIAKENNLVLPIVNTLYEVIFKGVDFSESFNILWNTDIGHETKKQKWYNLMVVKGVYDYMNKNEIIERISEKTGETKTSIETTINELITIIIKETYNGKKVTLSGLGTFSKIRRAARVGINPTTQESIKIPAKDAPKFKPAKRFKEFEA